MSTKERYGSAVWDALCTFSVYENGNEIGWVTAGEVADKAGVSVPTARKYLKDWVQTNYAKERKIGKKTFAFISWGGGD